MNLWVWFSKSVLFITYTAKFSHSYYLPWMGYSRGTLEVFERQLPYPYCTGIPSKLPHCHNNRDVKVSAVSSFFKNFLVQKFGFFFNFSPYLAFYADCFPLFLSLSTHSHALTCSSHRVPTEMSHSRQVIMLQRS